jgi:transcriptional coactivator p15 (PC4)
VKKPPAVCDRAGALSISDNNGNTNTVVLSETLRPAQLLSSSPQSRMLAKPIVVAKFWRNRRGEAVFVSFREYQGRALIDCRVHFTNKEGKLQPTAKGLALVVARLPDLAQAINKAILEAKRLGLLKEQVP